MSKRLSAWAALIIIVSMVLSACGPTPEPQIVEKTVKETVVVEQTVKETVIVEGTPQIVEKVITTTPEPQPEAAECGCNHEVIIGNNGDAKNINPILAVDASGFYETKMMFDTLIDVDLTTLVPKPRLAKSWDISDDGTTYTFHLVDADVRWHDGAPFTVDDIEFTLMQILKPTYTGIYQQGFADLVGADKVIAGEATELEGFKIIDDKTVQFKLNKPSAPFLARVIDQLRFLPKHLLEGQEITTEMPFSKAPIGTGPYKFASWDPGNRFVMERNEDYWGEKPCTKTITIVAIPDMQAIAMALEAGDIDTSNTLSTSDIVRLGQVQGLIDHPVPSHTAESMFFNFQNPILQDARVRRAIAQAIDFQAFTDNTLQGLTTPANTLITPVSWGHNPDAKLPEYDPENAKALLAEAGYPDGFKIRLSTNQGNNFRELFVEFAQAELAKVGIEVEVVKSEWGTFLQDAIDGNYDIRFQAEAEGMPDPDNLYDFFHTDGSTNRSRYSNPEVDKLLEQARVETDLEKRKQEYYQVQEILDNDVVALPAFWRPIHQVAKSKFGNFVPTPLYFFGGAHLWCSTEQ